MNKAFHDCVPGVLRRDGERFAQDTLGAGDLAAVRWPLGLWEHIEALELTGAPEAVDAHLAALAGPAGQNERLERAAAQRLAELREGLQEASGDADRG